MRIASRNSRTGLDAKTRLSGISSRSNFRDQDAFCAPGLRYSALSVSDYFFLAAFLTAVFTGAALATVLAGIVFTAATFFAVLGEAAFTALALGAVFLTSAGFFKV